MQKIIKTIILSLTLLPMTVWGKSPLDLIKILSQEKSFTGISHGLLRDDVCHLEILNLKKVGTYFYNRILEDGNEWLFQFLFSVGEDDITETLVTAEDVSDPEALTLVREANKEVVRYKFYKKSNHSYTHYQIIFEIQNQRLAKAVLIKKGLIDTKKSCVF